MSLNAKCKCNLPIKKGSANQRSTKKAELSFQHSQFLCSGSSAYPGLFHPQANPSFCMRRRRMVVVTATLCPHPAVSSEPALHPSKQALPFKTQTCQYSNNNLRNLILKSLFCQCLGEKTKQNHVLAKHLM